MNEQPGVDFNEVCMILGRLYLEHQISVARMSTEISRLRQEKQEDEPTDTD